MEKLRSQQVSSCLFASPRGIQWNKTVDISLHTVEFFTSLEFLTNFLLGNLVQQLRSHLGHLHPYCCSWIQVQSRVLIPTFFQCVPQHVADDSLGPWVRVIHNDTQDWVPATCLSLPSSSYWRQLKSESVEGRSLFSLSVSLSHSLILSLCLSD